MADQRWVVKVLVDDEGRGPPTTVIFKTYFDDEASARAHVPSVEREYRSEIGRGAVVQVSPSVVEDDGW